MTKHVQCPHCGQAYALTLEQVARLGGQTITCSECNASFLISKDDSITGGLATEPSTFDTRPEATAGAVSSFIPGITHANPAVAAAMGAAHYRQIASPMRGVRAQRTGANPWAVASLVCGLLAIVIPVVPGIFAIFLGLIALHRMRDDRDGGGLAMGGITVGVMGMLINGGVLVTYILPTIKQHQESSAQARCHDHLQKIATAMRAYADNSDGHFPDRLESILATQQLTADALICPATGDTVSPGKTPQEQLANLHNGPHVSYMYAGNELTTDSLPECVLLYEELDRHEPGMWVVFVDGRIQLIGEVEAEKAIRRLRQGQNPPWTITPK
jgi:predicted Zn finger-like uncharacterized protein